MVWTSNKWEKKDNQRGHGKQKTTGKGEKTECDGKHDSTVLTWNEATKVAKHKKKWVKFVHTVDAIYL